MRMQKLVASALRIPYFQPMSEPTKIPAGYTLFTYEAVDIPSNKRFTHYLLCHNFKDACALVGLWNSSNKWRYMTPVRVG